MTETAATESTISKPTAAQAKAALAKQAKIDAAAKEKTENAAKANDQALKNKLRNEAEREVLANHRDEFVAIAEKKFSENGLVFARRLTESEKAAKKIADLLEAHPELASQFPSAQPASEEPDVEPASEYIPEDEFTSGDNQPDYDMAYDPEMHGEEPVDQ